MTETASHKRRTLSGVIWNLFRVLGQTVLGLVTGVVLARLLVPEDFGLLALALVVIGMAELVAAAGMEPAVVQRRDLSDTHLRVATTMSLLSGVFLTLLFWMLATPISVFFKEPRVADILPVLAVGVGLAAATATSRGLLIRRMDFKTLFKIDLFSYLIGSAGVAIAMAVMGFGVWSLVVGSIVSVVIQSVALAFVEPLRFPLSLEKKELRELLGFGGEMSVNEIINYLARNVDYVVIGRYLEPGPLGLYYRAHSLSSMPLNKIAISFSGALFPSYSEIQNDRPRLARTYLRTISVTALVTFPILAGFIVAGELVIVGLFGEKWRAATAVFQILSLAGAFKTIYHLAGAVAQATNHVRAEIWRQMIYLGVLGIGSFLLVGQGIEAVGWAVVIASLWMYVAMAHLVGRIVGFGWRDFLEAQIPGLALAALVAVGDFAFIVANRLIFGLGELTALLLVIAISGVIAAGGFVYLPERLMGSTPGWMLQHLAPRLPGPLQRWIEMRYTAEWDD